MEAEKKDRSNLAVGLLATICVSLLIIGIGLVVQNARLANNASKDDDQTRDIAMTAQSQADANQAVLNTLIQAEVRKCRLEQERLIQGKERGQALRDVLGYLIELIPISSVAASQEAQDTVRVFQRHLSHIEILPIPRCGDVGADLREHFHVEPDGGGGRRSPSGGSG